MNKFIKRIGTISILISLSLFLSCGTFLRTAFGMKDTSQCKQMEKVCKEADEYRKLHESDKNNSSQDSRMQALDEDCSKCRKECSESQNRYHDNRDNEKK